MLKLLQNQIEIIFAHARESFSHECCGLIGGQGNFANSVYKLENIATNPLVEYAAAPEDLFAAQRLMCERGETLAAIYHSHPRQAEPVPSQTDVRRAFYPQAVYLIVGFCGREPVLRAFRISEAERSWTPAPFEIIAARENVEQNPASNVRTAKARERDSRRQRF